MKTIVQYLKKYKLESILGPFFKMLEASFELLVPLVMASIIDKGIANADKPYIFRMCGVLVLLAAIGLTCALCAQYFAAKAAVGMATGLRSALFAHIQELSFSEIDTIGVSTLITRMTSDINQVQSGVNLVLRLFLRSPFVVFGAMIMAFTVDVKAALVFAVTIPLLSLVVFGIMLLTMPRYKKVQAGVDRVLGRTRENLGGARVIRAFHKEAAEEQDFVEDNSRLTMLQLGVGRISALTNPVTYVIINLSVLAVIWIGGCRVNSGYITQGEVVALVNYMSQILVELIKLANLIVSITKALACMSRIDDVFAATASITDAEAVYGLAEDPEEKEMVAFDHVSLTYAGTSEEALTDIHFTVYKGQTIGIIGGTGSGKTSVVHLIGRYYDATSGQVRVNGINVRKYPLAELRGKIGMVMQKAVLFSGTIAENLRWGKPDASDADLWRAVELAQAVDVVEGKEGGLNFHIEEGGKNLSGGQRQRLTIARALVRDPQILILDDSSSALDFATDAKLRSALRTLKDKTVFIVSQRTSSIQYADKILVLDDGQQEGFGTHEELLAGCQVYKEIYESQFRKEDDLKSRKSEEGRA